MIPSAIANLRMSRSPSIDVPSLKRSEGAAA
jgi:hypothetical protein